MNGLERRHGCHLLFMRRCGYSLPMIVTRFAPSPTGYLHLGHAFSAVNAWRRARANGGRFMLRLEDIDPHRCRPEYATAILGGSGLARTRLGYGPRSRRLQSDASWTPPTRTLRAGAVPAPGRLPNGSGRLRNAGCSTHVSAPAPTLFGRSPPPSPRRMGRTARRSTQAPAAGYPPPNEAIGSPRVSVSRCASTSRPSAVQDWNTRRRVKAASVPPGALRRRGARPQGCARQLPSLRDPRRRMQGVTLVTRGQDLRPATDLHRLLQALMGWPAPVYAHHRLLLDPSAAAWPSAATRSR